MSEVIEFPMDYSDFKFAKPAKTKREPRKEKLELTARERSALRKKLFGENSRCTSCGCQMTLEIGLMITATLEHEVQGKMGERKDDRQIKRLTCFRCNFLRGSKRNFKYDDSQKPSQPQWGRKSK